MIVGNSFRNCCVSSVPEDGKSLKVWCGDDGKLGSFRRTSAPIAEMCSAEHEFENELGSCASFDVTCTCSLSR